MFLLTLSTIDAFLFNHIIKLIRLIKHCYVNDSGFKFFLFL